MSKRLSRAMTEGTVSVTNTTAGEVMIKIPLKEGGMRTLTLPPHSTTELAPKYTDAMLLSRSPNLGSLMHRGTLRII